MCVSWAPTSHLAPAVHAAPALLQHQGHLGERVHLRPGHDACGQGAHGGRKPHRYYYLLLEQLLCESFVCLLVSVALCLTCLPPSTCACGGAALVPQACLRVTGLGGAVSCHGSWVSASCGLQQGTTPGPCLTMCPAPSPPQPRPALRCACCPFHDMLQATWCPSTMRATLPVMGRWSHRRPSSQAHCRRAQRCSHWRGGCARRRAVCWQPAWSLPGTTAAPAPGERDGLRLRSRGGARRVLPIVQVGSCL